MLLPSQAEAKANMCSMALAGAEPECAGAGARARGSGVRCGAETVGWGEMGRRGTGVESI